eukprot:COSAG06_NODE_30188_length_543_cov_0.846847_1_plen_146_part_10
MLAIGIRMDAVALFKHIDKDGNGQVDMEEWEKTMKGCKLDDKVRATEDDLKKMLQGVLKDRDEQSSKTFSPTDISNGLRQLGLKLPKQLGLKLLKQQAQAMTAQVDADSISISISDLVEIVYRKLDDPDSKLDDPGKVKVKKVKPF